MESSGMNWRKTSYSGNGGGNCVEAADDIGTVMVRDTADRDGVALTFSGQAWERFIKGL